MGYTVADSRKPLELESHHEHVKDAIKAALASGYDVYVHADDCNDPTQELGPGCPCKPLKIKGRRV